MSEDRIITILIIVTLNFSGGVAVTLKHEPGVPFTFDEIEKVYKYSIILYVVLHYQFTAK